MKTISKIVLGAAALLIIPLGAMQFLDGFNWTGSDFVFAWAMLVGMGVSLITVLDKTKSIKIRAIGGLFILALIWLYIELAVGLFTPWGS